MIEHKMPPTMVSIASTDTGTNGPYTFNAITNGAHKMNERPQIPADNIRTFFSSGLTRSAVQAVNIAIPDEIVTFKAIHAIIASPF